MTRQYKLYKMGLGLGWFLISKCGPRQTPADNLLWHWATGKTTILHARIQHYHLPKHFYHSRTPVEKMKNWKYGEFFFGKNWKNQCDFYSIILLMYLICAVLYGSHTVARSTNYPYKTSVAVFVKLVNSKYTH